jgi:Lamin Tail Domain
MMYLCLAACTRPNSGSVELTQHDDLPDLKSDQVTAVDLAGADFATKPVDLASPPDLGSPSDLTSADLTTLPDLSPPPDLTRLPDCVKINELLLSTTAGAKEEYVELYNTCPVTIDLAGWSLVYRSLGNNGGAVNPDVLLAPLNVLIAGQAHLVFSGTLYAGTHEGTLLNSLSDAGGGVALIDNTGVRVDAVAYGPVVADHNFLEGGAAPLPPLAASPGMVVARVPDGADSNNASADFQVATPTPRAPN